MIKFNGDLTPGDWETQWDSETELIATGAYIGGYYVVTTPTGSTATIQAYLEKTIQDTRAIHGKFTFKVKNDYTFHSNKLIRLFELFKGSTGSLRLSFESNGTAKDLTKFYFGARTAANSYTTSNAITVDLGTGNSPFTPDTDAEFVFYAQMSTNNTNPNGIFMLWLDGNIFMSKTDLDWAVTTSDIVDTVQFGVISCSINPDDANEETFSFKNFQLSNNGLYDSDLAQTYWLDGTNGTELGTGSASLPMKYAVTAMSCPIIGNGDEVKLVDNGKLSPQRSNDTGPLEFPVDGTANNSMVMNGNNVIYTGSTEHEFTGTGEHEITGIVQDPHRIYVCTQADWDAKGWDALDARKLPYAVDTVSAAAGSAVRTNGTVTSLAVGEAGYSGTSVFYNSGGAAVHIEIPIRRLATSIDYVLGPTTDFFDYKNMSIWMGRLYTIRPPSGGVGSVFRHSEIMEAWNVCFNNSGDADLYMCKAYYTRKWGSDSDCVIQNGAGNTLSCEIHAGLDDGISHNNGSGDAVGNVVFDGGYYEGGSSAGIEFTGTPGATGTPYFNTVVGWTNSGILLNNLTNPTNARNNISVSNKGNGYNALAPNNTVSGMDNNCAYNNGNDFWRDGGAVTPANTITSDPEFTLLAAGRDRVDRSGDDYHVSAASPVRDPDQDPSNDVVIKYWGTGPRPEGQDGAIPDRLATMGAYL